MHRLLSKTKNRGFTLMELLVVVAIMAILFVAVAMVARTSINRAKVAKAQADLNRIAKAIRQLEVDTELSIGGLSITDCTGNVEQELTDANDMGIITDNGAARWGGPYMENLPSDPWGQAYRFDPDYYCHPETQGCDNLPDNQIIRAVYSAGPNKSPISGTAEEMYDDDNVVLKLCIRP